MVNHSSDVIIALAGGTNASGELLPRNYRRIDTALKLRDMGVADHIIFVGGSLLNQRLTQTEPELMKEYALEEIRTRSGGRDKGRDEAELGEYFIEVGGAHEGIGQAVMAKREMVKQKWSSATVVASKSYLPRSIAVFRHVFGKGYDLQGEAAPEAVGPGQKIWEGLGNLMTAYVLEGTEWGDEAGVYQNLAERAPGYGDNGVTLLQLGVHSLRHFARHPSSLVLPIPGKAQAV